MSINTSSTAQDFNRLYGDVAAGIAAATAEIDQLDIDHKSGQQEIGNILARLRQMQAGFDHELGLLEEHAEWEKFTIAFFGETNAGKSTIIESLRILFNEQSRQQLLEQNGRDLQRYEEALHLHLETARRGFAQAHAAYVADIASVGRDFDSRSVAFLDATAARTSSVKRELTALENTVQAQFTTIDTLERTVQAKITALGALDQALRTARRNTWLASVAGCVLGAVIYGVISFALQ